MLSLDKYSVGISDYFNRQANAQLAAFQLAATNGVSVSPVWNKSLLEYTLTGTTPVDFQLKTKQAAKDANWKSPVIIDSESITTDNVDLVIDSCNYFTFNIADFVETPASSKKTEVFSKLVDSLFGEISIEGIDAPFLFTSADIQQFIHKYLGIIESVGSLYQYLLKKKGKGHFITEISLADIEKPLSAIDTYFLYAAISIEGISINTFAPRFSSRFFRSIDFNGNISTFEKEFELNTLLIRQAKQQFNLPSDLKISIHAGCDKPLLYPVLNKICKLYDVGLHIKTSGFTWLNECHALVMASEDSLDLIKSIYAIAMSRIDELSKPYSKQLNIDKSKLPSSAEMFVWTSAGMASALTPGGADYNPNLRQLMSIAYKVAVEYGDIFTEVLDENSEAIAQQISQSIYNNLLQPLFLES